MFSNGEAHAVELYLRKYMDDLKFCEVLSTALNVQKLTYVNLEFPYVPQPDLILLKLVDFRLFHALVDTNVLTQLSDIAPSSLKALILSTCRLRNEETLYENFWSVIMSALSLDLLVHTRLNPVTKYDLNR